MGEDRDLCRTCELGIAAGDSRFARHHSVEGLLIATPLSGPHPTGPIAIADYLEVSPPS